MLVLSRKTRQSIMIGDDIEVTVVEVKGDLVRLAIRAPRQVTVHRREVYDEVMRENTQASAISPDHVLAIERMIDSNREQ